MNDSLTVNTERVDDIPILLTQMDQMGLVELVNEHFAPHGNWQGISPGQLICGWLGYVLSEADHRLNRVQTWAEKRLQTLGSYLGETVQAQDFTDDRLAIQLDALGNDANWAQLEAALNRRTIRVYDLGVQRVRLDSTTASGHWKVTEDGLFQFGHSKDRRPDLPQVKVMLSALDPLGMPLVSQTVSGERADDPLYIPAIQQVRAGLARQGLLYVGDVKMMALETRAFVQAGGDFYLGPMSKIQVPAAALEAYLKPVWTKEQLLTPIYREQVTGQQKKIAEGFECEESRSSQKGAETLSWTERRLVIRSLQVAQAAEQALQTRLAKAQAELDSLNVRKQGKKRHTKLGSLQAAAQAIVKRQRVTGLLQVKYEERVQERPVRRYGERAAQVRSERAVQVQVSRDEPAIQQAIDRLGWRVYSTNQAAEQLSLSQAVLAYREAYLIEQGFGRLKGKPLSLTPMYLHDDQRATGLIRLLTIGLRVLTLFEFVVRRRLAQETTELAGLYAGNPKRSTARPTTEALLQAFKEITLTEITIEDHVHRHLTPLTELQRKILALLGFPSNIYTKLTTDSQNPP